jgi:hypothetical protein
MSNNKQVRTMETTNELSRVQRMLKAPKDQTNQFGKYKYRKAEDILQAVKPHLGNLSIVMSDDIEVIGNRFFLKATASLCNNEGAPIAAAHAFAELDEHKGMSKEQATGAASSYARKYALCGLLAIDDSSNDPDTLAPAEPKAEAKVTAPAVTRSSDVLDMVRAAENIAMLTAIWNANRAIIEKDDMLRASFTKRKAEIQQANQ